MHRGILINMSYSWTLTVAGAFSYTFLQFMIVYYLLCSRAFHIFVLRHKTEAKTANQCNYNLYCEKMFPMYSQFPNNVRIKRRSIITVIQSQSCVLVVVAVSHLFENSSCAYHGFNEVMLSLMKKGQVLKMKSCDLLADDNREADLMTSFGRKVRLQINPYLLQLLNLSSSWQSSLK